jgi:hypothetical protein
MFPMMRCCSLLSVFFLNKLIIIQFTVNLMVFSGQVYRETVEPIIPIIFQRTKATCFAYGQTGLLVHSIITGLSIYISCIIVL